MVDLSFTKDAKWIEERKQHWLPIRKSLSEDFRKKDLDKIEHYFFTGDLSGYKLTDGAKFSYFPLQSPEAWDYILQDLLSDAASLEDIIYYHVIHDLSDRGLYTFEQELQFWDYFIGERYEPIVKSRVPIKPTGQIAEVKLDLCRVLSVILSMLGGYCYYAKFDNQPKWVVKIEYLYSALDALQGANVESSQHFEHVCTLVSMLLDLAVDFTPRKVADDPDKNREKFVMSFAQKMATLSNLPEPLKAIWDERKSKIKV